MATHRTTGEGENAVTIATIAEGAEPLHLIKLDDEDENEVYRIATSSVNSENKIEYEDGAVTSFTTSGKKIVIKGVDGDVTYALKETEAPAGYNMLTDLFPIAPDKTNTLAAVVKNNAGSVLPSTGGTGTVIFYVVGGILVAGAGVFLAARRKMAGKE